MEKLSEQEVTTRLKLFNHWSVQNGELKRQFVCKDFVTAMSFVNKIADLAEMIGHHPDILIQYNKVTLTLVTHDAGGLTENDFNLASRIDTVY